MSLAVATRGRALATLACALALVTACSPNEPLRIGFIGGLSGTVADLGEAGRDGALLAVEEANAQGGIKGRRIDLRIFDDAQRAAQAVSAVEALAKERIEAAVGPMTSAMGQAALPVAERLGVLLVSPTITASPLRGRDDQLFLVSPGVAELTQQSAEALHARRVSRVALAYDLRNEAYSRDWILHFRRAFESLGGRVVAEEAFSSNDLAGAEGVMRAMLAANPDSLHFVASAVDTVRLVQVARHQGGQLVLSAATWAATEHLGQLGGRSVEGMLVIQFFNRDDESPRYAGFRNKFLARFGQQPGFAAVAAYDATRALLLAYDQRRAGELLKTALLTAGPFEGLQERWVFDTSGDARRNSFVAVVREGRFVINTSAETK